MNTVLRAVFAGVATPHFNADFSDFDSAPAVHAPSPHAVAETTRAFPVLWRSAAETPDDLQAASDQASWRTMTDNAEVDLVLSDPSAERPAYVKSDMGMWAALGFPS